MVVNAGSNNYGEDAAAEKESCTVLCSTENCLLVQWLPWEQLKKQHMFEKLNSYPLQQNLTSASFSTILELEEKKKKIKVLKPHTEKIQQGLNWRQDLTSGAPASEQYEWCMGKSCTQEKDPSEGVCMEEKGGWRKKHRRSTAVLSLSHIPSCPSQDFRGSGVLLWWESRNKQNIPSFWFGAQSNSYLQFGSSNVHERNVEFKTNRLKGLHLVMEHLVKGWGWSGSTGKLFTPVLPCDREGWTEGETTLGSYKGHLQKGKHLLYFGCFSWRTAVWPEQPSSSWVSSFLFSLYDCWPTWGYFACYH